MAAENKNTSTLGVACAVAGAVTLTAVALGGPALGETLREALVLAYQNNPVLSADQARLRATDEGVAQALANWRPTVSIDGEISKERVDTVTQTSDSEINREQYSIGITIDQNIYRGGRTLAATRRAENLVRADRARLSSTEQSVLLDAATAYVDVVRDKSLVELNLNNEKVLRRQLDATKDRFRVGEITRTDVAQAESRLSRAKADRIKAEGDLISSRAVYLNVIGVAPGKLEPAKPVTGLPKTEEEAVSLARSQNFDLIQSDFTERAAKERVREVFGELLPTVTLTATFDERRNTLGTRSKIDRAEIAASVSIPLYQSGSVSSRVRAAKQTAAQRRYERSQSLRDVTESATRAWESLTTTRARKVSFSAEVRAAKIALEGVQQEALVGSRTVLDVLDAEQELLDARVSLVGAERDEVVATFRLRSSIGQLTAAKLDLPGNLYNPEKHYRNVRGRWFGIRVGGE